jgi:hypothetical protein
VAVRDAVLKTVEARPQGAIASEILEYVSQEFGRNAGVQGGTESSNLLCSVGL